MKKTLLLVSSLCSSVALVAQTVPDAIQLIYHERYQSAKTSLHQVLQADPGNGAAWYYLSQAYLPLKEIQPLADSLQRANVAVKDNPYYKAAYGQLLLAQNKVDSARTYFNQAIGEGRKRPGHPPGGSQCMDQ
ncbi:tetratricopeptide repeat protein [Paraflavitalea speifideaquila]|uniref:tetratricopeptide repeat protein n=1 Tax=Paraflavitalea speifideaquila TaxID=3076558 RepID=UPI0028E86C54|nr:tetratricopeptide repeat protein [Paraflavitalea speifideiaquila]